jgi:tRNA threonylcarbamoyladenosine biosynthesis protein TsaE
MPKQFCITLSEEKMQVELAPKLASFIENKACIIYLSGEMGSGKTALIRHIIKSLGYDGTVTSPSFNILNVYDLNTTFIHCDLYRFKNFDAPEILMLDDYFNIANYLIEWPEHALEKAIPSPDIEINIKPEKNYKQRKYTITVYNNSYIFNYK